MEVSIAICTRNRQEKLERCLDSLTTQLKYFSELIVIEDTTDNILYSQEKLRRKVGRSSKIKLQYYQVQFGSIPRSRNLALQATTGDILIFIDDDVIASSESIRQVSDFFTTTPSASLVTGKVVSDVPDNPISQLDQLYFNQGVMKLSKTAQIRMCPFSFVGLRLSDIQKLHLTFDEQFFNGEDIDFSFSLWKLGKKLYFHHQLENFHSFDTSLLSFFHKKYQHGQGIFSLYQKHGDQFMPGSELLLETQLSPFPFQILKQAFRNTRYYAQLQPLSLAQKIIVYLGEVATLVGSSKTRFKNW